MSKQSVPDICCDKARWAAHHFSGRTRLQCTRFTGAGGAWYMNPQNPPCRLCRFNVGGYEVPDKSDFVNRVARDIARGMCADTSRAREVLAEIMGKGKSGMDATEPGVQELLQKALLEASARGLSPDAALDIGREIGIVSGTRSE